MKNEDIGCLGCLGCIMFCLVLCAVGYGTVELINGEETLTGYANGLIGAIVIGGISFLFARRGFRKAAKNKLYNEELKAEALVYLASNCALGDTKSQFICKSCSTVCTCGENNDKGKYKCPKCVDGNARFLGNCCVNHVRPMTCKECGNVVQTFAWSGKGWENA